MAIKVGVNGFGRIGRLFTRAALKSGDIEIVGINDITDAKTLAHLFKYDSVHGRYDGTVEAGDSSISIDGKEIPISAERDPASIPWDKWGATVVAESTGLFTLKADASKHIKGDVKKVVVSAPSKDADVTIVVGVNSDAYDAAKHTVMSNASCTTNCLAPVAKVLHDNWTIKSGLMTTIHAYTGDQCILDAPHKDLRRARSAALSMIPTKTGAAAAISLVIPDLKGKLDGFAIRVPTPNVSVVDLTCIVEKSATPEEINAAVKAASEGPLKGILGYSEEPLVSVDYNGSTQSSNFDAQNTRVIDGNLVKVLSWYDNEYGFSNRMVDLIKIVA